MDRINPVLALATLLVSLTIKNVSQLGNALVTVAGTDTAKTFAAALVTAVDSCDYHAADCDCCDHHNANCECGDCALRRQESNSREYFYAPQGTSLVMHFNPNSERIAAIKAVRLLTAWGLRESKDWVDSAVDSFGPGVKPSTIDAVLFHNMDDDLAYAVQDFYVLHTEAYTAGSWVRITNQPASVAQRNPTSHLAATSTHDFTSGWGVKLYANTRDNTKISMIKAYRAAFDYPVGLKDAKHIVDQAFGDRRPMFNGQPQDHSVTMFLNSGDSLVEAVARARKADDRRRIDVTVAHESTFAHDECLSTFASRAGVNVVNAGLEYR